MHNGCERRLPASLLIEYDLLYLAMPCPFFRSDGRVGLGEDGDVVVCHGQLRFECLSDSQVGVIRRVLT